LEGEACPWLGVLRSRALCSAPCGPGKGLLRGFGYQRLGWLFSGLLSCRMLKVTVRLLSAMRGDGCEQWRMCTGGAGVLTR
jgi:hypothetical protein